MKADSASGRELPKNLRPVLEIIPKSCYDNPTWKGLAYTARDFALYGLLIVTLASTDVWWQVLALWAVLALSVSGLFILGHDAAHQALFRSKKLNGLIGRLTMLPSLHVFEGWVYGHNRLHHGHTVQQQFDFVWHPCTPAEWEKKTARQKLLHRLEWSCFGPGLYYGYEIWWKGQMSWEQPKKYADVIHRDHILVLVYAAVVTALAAWFGFSTYGTLLGALWAPLKLVWMPFIGFLHVIGWAVYVHHIDPDIQWHSRREWNKFRGQMEGTTILRMSPMVDLFLHKIMVHVPHHVDQRIPFYKLDDAALAILAHFPDIVREKKFRFLDYVAATQVCKLYDFEKQQWLPYPKP